jgi:hypothetical protein
MFLILNDKEMPLTDWFDFSSSYVQRVLKDLPKRGTKAPWHTKPWYLSDYSCNFHRKI